MATIFSPGTGAGSGATASVAGSDGSGVLTLTTGIGSLPSSTLGTLAFDQPYSMPPTCVLLTPANQAAASFSGGLALVSNLKNNGFDVLSSLGKPLDSTIYKWFYSVVIM